MKINTLKSAGKRIVNIHYYNNKGEFKKVNCQIVNMNSTHVLLRNMPFKNLFLVKLDSITRIKANKQTHFYHYIEPVTFVTSVFDKGFRGIDMIAPKIQFLSTI